MHKTCDLCGTQIQSATASYCVACYRKCCHPCTTCMEMVHGKAKLRFEFQDHQQPRPGQVCTRCDRLRVKHDKDEHPWQFQAACPECKNERVVFREPEGAKA